MALKKMKWVELSAWDWIRHRAVAISLPSSIAVFVACGFFARWVIVTQPNAIVAPVVTFSVVIVQIVVFAVFVGLFDDKLKSYRPKRGGRLRHERVLRRLKVGLTVAQVSIAVPTLLFFAGYLALA